MTLPRCALELEDQIALDRLLDEAFAPARLRTATISPARVRARVAWEPAPAVGRGWHVVSVLGRLGEATLGFGMMAILFAASLGSVAAPATAARAERGGEPVAGASLSLDDTRFLRLLRIGHPVPARAVRVRDDLDPTTMDLRPADEAEPVTSARERRALPR